MIPKYSEYDPSKDRVENCTIRAIEESSKYSCNPWTEKSSDNFFSKEVSMEETQK